MAIAPALQPLDHARRVNDLAAMLPLQNGADAMLFTDLIDVRWLTGFTGSNGWVVVTPDELTLGTDGRYGDRARAETASSGAKVVAESSRSRLHEHLIALLGARHRVALDAGTTTHAEWQHLASELSLLPTASLVAVQRRVKDAAEVERIQAAAAAADAALVEVEPMLFASVDHPVTESDIRNELEYRMRLHGADDRSYDTIVASGPEHASRPHHEPGGRKIVEGDTVIIDVGALVDGYHSDMTRSYVIGEPTGEQRALYGLVEAAHRAGIEALGPGVAARSVDRICRELFEAAGYGDWFLHGTGHGVGLQIHESPFHSATSDEDLLAGNVVTIEPGLYRGGVGGFRIEDLLIVTETGSRQLTHTVPRPFIG